MSCSLNQLIINKWISNWIKTFFIWKAKFCLCFISFYIKMHFICCLKHYIQTEQSRKRLVLNSSVSLTIVVILSGWCRLQSYTHWLFTWNKRHILLIGCAVYPWAAFSRQVSTASGIRMTECPFFVHIDWFECARLKMSVQYIKQRKKINHTGIWN